MKSIGLIAVGYLIATPHVFYAWRDLLWSKGKKSPKDRRNLYWNAGLTTLLLLLLVGLTVETFQNEFSLVWCLTLASIVALFLFWSNSYMPRSGGGRA